MRNQNMSTYPFSQKENSFPDNNKKAELDANVPNKTSIRIACFHLNVIP